MATPTLPILEAVNTVIDQIRYEHPEVPQVTVVLGGQGRSKKAQVHGHFAPNTWHHDEAVHEIFLSGESLARGAEATLGTLLHECAHALAHARGIKDTSNGGRYHNAKFAEIGEELGIELEKDGTRGWSSTTVPPRTAEHYADEVETLASVLTAYRKVVLAPEKDPKERKTTKLKITCDCEDNEVTVSKKWWEQNEDSLRCDNCLEAFKAVDE